jgi:hypothetical protein
MELVDEVAIHRDPDDVGRVYRVHAGGWVETGTAWTRLHYRLGRNGCARCRRAALREGMWCGSGAGNHSCVDLMPIRRNPLFWVDGA